MTRILCLLLLMGVAKGFHQQLSSLANSPLDNFVVPKGTLYTSTSSNPHTRRKFQWHSPVESQASVQSLEVESVLAPSRSKTRSGARGRRIVHARKLEIESPNYFEMATGTIARVGAKTWWSLPMVLAVVPLHSAIFQGSSVAMPHWWQVVKMDAVMQSQNAMLVVGGFLFSNIAYFASGAYLLAQFPLQRSKRGILPFCASRFAMLGVWILIAGSVSTVFHSVQALGSYAVAESLCYVDHGVAISSGLYFFDTCGMPSPQVLAIGIAGLAALVLTHPGYPLLHSTWHFLSAAAATRWAVEGYAKQNLTSTDRILKSSSWQ